jgi:hypothetical protein
MDHRHNRYLHHSHSISNNFHIWLNHVHGDRTYNHHNYRYVASARLILAVELISTPTDCPCTYSVQQTTSSASQYTAETTIASSKITDSSSIPFTPSTHTSLILQPTISSRGPSLSQSFQPISTPQFILTPYSNLRSSGISSSSSTLTSVSVVIQTSVPDPLTSPTITTSTQARMSHASSPSSTQRSSSSRSSVSTSSVSTTMLPPPISTGGMCGARVDLTCEGSFFGNCRGSDNTCGTDAAHCGTGCQSDFGYCTFVSNDGTCGNNVTCEGSVFGSCKSSGPCSLYFYAVLERHYSLAISSYAKLIKE